MNSAFINTLINTFKKSFSFEGRSSRSEMWQWIFPTIIAMQIFYILPSRLYPGTTYAIISQWIFFVCFFVPSCSISVRRFHDLGHNGWFTLLTFIPILGFIPSIYELFWRGEKEANKYGLVPISQNLTGFDKIWLWAFIAIPLLYVIYIGYKFSLLNFI